MADTPPNSSSGSASPPPGDLPPLAFRETDPCPGCGKEIKVDALVCVHCGYDFRKGAKVQTTTGAEAAPEPKASDTNDDDQPDDLIRPGRGSAKVLGITAGVLLVGACVAAGLTVGPSATTTNVMARIASTGLDGVLHALTGLIALSAAAFYFGMRLGRIDLGGARVAAAWCLFLLVHRLPIPAGSFSIGAAWLAGIAAYFLLLWGLMARHPRVVGVVAATHFGLYAGFNLLLTVLTALEAAGVSPAPGTAQTPP